MTEIFTGWEDFCFSPIGAPTITTVAARFRAGFARCGLQVSPPTSGYMAWRLPPSSFALTVPASSWFTARFYNDIALVSTSGSILSFNSAGDIPRVRLFKTAGTAGGFAIQRINAAGTATTLVTSSGELAVRAVSKLDINMTYAVGGFIAVYADGDLLAQYSGDLTTDGVTVLTGVDLSGLQFMPMTWSEVIWDTLDTRSWGLATQAPAAAGNTVQWSGAVGDVNEITLNDSTGNSTPTASQIQQYTVNGLPAGNWQVIRNTVQLRAMASPGAPQNINASVRTGGTDYFSPDIAPGASLSNQRYTWATNPGTGLPWTPAELNSAGYNIGVRSVA